MLWLGAGVLILLVFILGIRLFVTVKFSFLPEQHMVYGKVTVLKIPFYTKTVELDNEQQNTNNFMQYKDRVHTYFEDSDNRIKTVIHSRHLAKAWLRRLSVRRFEWQTVLGAEEADITGIAVGGIWSIKTMLIGAMSHLVHFKNAPDIDVTPRYQQNYFSTQFECVLSMSIGQILYCIFLLLRYR